MRPLKLVITTLIYVCLCPASVTAQQVNSLDSAISKILTGKQATVGVAVCPIGSTDTVSFNGASHLPMQSVFKFHIALAVLDQVDKGTLELNRKIKIAKSDLLPDTWSPIRDKYPNAGISLTVADLIEYTVAQSDNNGCDILLRLIGGTEVVERYLYKTGARDVEIKVNEQQMHLGWDVQYRNWTTPKSAMWLLSHFYAGNAVSAQSREFLNAIMVNTSTGAKRLKGQLPAGAIVAHKTGTSGTNAQGISAATNDIGIVTLPGGAAYAIAIFVSDSAEDNQTNEAIIAEISKAAWQYYNETL